MKNKIIGFLMIIPFLAYILYSIIEFAIKDFSSLIFPLAFGLFISGTFLVFYYDWFYKEEEVEDEK